MCNKLVYNILGLFLLSSMLLFFGACAKKQIQLHEEIQDGPSLEADYERQTRLEEERRKQLEDAQRLEERIKQEEAQQLREEQLKKQQDQITAFTTEKIYFDYDRSDLKAISQTILKKKADWLMKNPEYRVRIEGHCDERGTSEYNLALGEKRAYSAKTFLLAIGVAEGRIITMTYGEERPAVPDHNEAAWSENRRDEFKLIK